MGYNVTGNGNIVIPKENLDEAYKVLCALNDRDDLKNGGSWGGGGIDASSPRPAGMNYHPAKWFSWMHANYPEVCPTTQSIFEQLDFWCHVNDAGDLVISGYDNKTGAEDIFLAAVSHLMTKGSYMEWVGEDGAQWRNEFGGKEVKNFSAVIQWVRN